MVLNEGRYEFAGNVDPLAICETYGCPVYIYDSSVITKQYKRLVDAIEVPNFKINYACKALTNINILRHLRTLGSGLDTVSIQEVELGLKAGFNPADIVYTPNCVSFEEIEKAVAYGVKINIDNISILELFGDRFPNHPVCIRINPHIYAGGNSKISVGHIDSKFGISFHQIPLVKRIVKSLNINVEGLHMHTGSDILDVEVFLRGADILFNTAMEFEGLSYLDFGSGFKVPYKPNDISTDIEELGSNISKRFNDFCSNYGSELTLMFEPGKFLVSEAGYFLTKVNVVKQTISTIFAGVDSGLNHLIRPMFYGSHHEIFNVSNPEGKSRIYTVVGYICETDTFGVNRKITEIKEGDILAFKNAGAYCSTMASNYNSRYRPAEVLVHEGEAHLIKKRETMDDLLRNQVEIPTLANTLAQ